MNYILAFKGTILPFYESTIYLVSQKGTWAFQFRRPPVKHSRTLPPSKSKQPSSANYNFYYCHPTFPQIRTNAFFLSSFLQINLQKPLSKLHIIQLGTLCILGLLCTVHLQVDNFQKVPFVHHFVRKFGRFFYTALLSCRISAQIL